MKKAFTLLELLVVIAIISILMGLIMAIAPTGESAVTLARIANISSAVDTYHEHYHAYPRSFHYDDGVNDYRWKDFSTNAETKGTLADLLTVKSLRRRDGKRIARLYDAEQVEMEEENGHLHFIDGWENKFVYYSGAEIAEANTDIAPGGAKSYVIAFWLRAAGGIDSKKTPAELQAMKGSYNSNNYYFLISAGEDGVFSYLVTAESKEEPSYYKPSATYLTSSNNTGPAEFTGEHEGDDMTNFTINR